MTCQPPANEKLISNEPWPFRDAILAVWALTTEALNCIEGCSEDELRMNEEIIRACKDFESALSRAAPSAYLASRKSIEATRATPPAAPAEDAAKKRTDAEFQLAMRLHEIQNVRDENVRLAAELAAMTQERDEVRQLRIKLAACGVAALQNTQRTAGYRLEEGDPAWSASYRDVCNAVDREMALRDEVMRLTAERDAARAELAAMKAGAVTDALRSLKRPVEPPHADQCPAVWYNKALDDVAAALQAVVGAGTQAARDLLAERERQKSAEGWTPEHDDEHGDGSLANAAACYAMTDRRMFKRYHLVDDGMRGGETVPEHWPQSWAASWWKPKDRRRDLVRAGALILAEIERLDRRATGEGE